MDPTSSRRFSPALTKRGRTRSAGWSRVSRTSRRTAADWRSRCGRSGPRAGRVRRSIRKRGGRACRAGRRRCGARRRRRAASPDSPSASAVTGANRDEGGRRPARRDRGRRRVNPRTVEGEVNVTASGRWPSASAAAPGVGLGERAVGGDVLDSGAAPRPGPLRSPRGRCRSGAGPRGRPAQEGALRRGRPRWPRAGRSRRARRPLRAPRPCPDPMAAVRSPFGSPSGHAACTALHPYATPVALVKTSQAAPSSPRAASASAAGVGAAGESGGRGRGACRRRAGGGRRRASRPGWRPASRRCDGPGARARSRQDPRPRPPPARRARRPRRRTGRRPGPSAALNGTSASGFDRPGAVRRHDAAPEAEASIRDRAVGGNRGAAPAAERGEKLALGRDRRPRLGMIERGRRAGARRRRPRGPGRRGRPGPAPAASCRGPGRRRPDPRCPAATARRGRGRPRGSPPRAPSGCASRRSPADRPDHEVGALAEKLGAAPEAARPDRRAGREVRQRVPVGADPGVARGPPAPSSRRPRGRRGRPSAGP